MRKRSFILAIIIFSFTSCVIESYEKPNKTTIGHNLACEVNSNICQFAAVADIVRGIELWSAATTNKDRYDIEDLFFRGLDIRDYGDTIFLGNLYKISRESLPVSRWNVHDVNNSSVFYQVSSIISESSYDGCYNVNMITIPSLIESVGVLNVSYKGTKEGMNYEIEGTIDMLVSQPMSNNYSKVSYIVQAPLKFRFDKSTNVICDWRSAPYRNIVEGQVKISAKKIDSVDVDSVGIKYFASEMEVSYNGFTDMYSYYHSYYENRLLTHL